MSLREEIEHILYQDVSKIDSDPEETAGIVINKILDAAFKTGRAAQIDYQKKNGVFSDSGNSVLKAINQLRESEHEGSDNA
jgi:hypothetical protein